MGRGKKIADYLMDATEINKGYGKVGKTAKVIKSPFNFAGNIAADAMVGGPRKVGKMLDDKLPNGNPMPFTRKTDSNIGNLWTGRREGGGAIAVGGVVGAGYMGYSTTKQVALAPKTGEISYSGAPPVMNADGVSSTSQAPGLNATGDMVFGLHNARKG